MSRLGKMPIALPKGVDVKMAKDGSVQIKGPKGTLQLQFPLGITLKIDGQFAVVERDGTTALMKTMHGLYRSLLQNAVIGVNEGFMKKLALIGVGYRAAVKGHKLDLQVGFSHPTSFDIPKAIQVEVDEKGVLITIKGMDKHEVGQFAAIVRALKSPEPYKGKGIRYEDEYVRKKEGKAAKAAATA
jgi:large subunit ribosomal protein L6